jgi:hypothetical protein
MRFYALKISGGGTTAPADDSGSASLGDVTGTVGNETVTVPGGSGTGTPPTSSSPPSDQWTADAGIDWGSNANAPQTDTSTGRNITVHKSVPATIQPVSGSPINGAQWTSNVNGVNDPGALHIEFEITLPVGATDTPAAACVTVYGIPLSVVSQASDFNNKTLELYAGYSEGLPLANLQVPHQGLILKGNILPCFGNWISNNTSISFVVVPSDNSVGSGGLGGPTDPKNIVHNMPVGTPLSEAMKNTLSTAFPGATVNVNISPKLVLPNNDYSFHQSLAQYGNYIRALSYGILGTPNKTGYSGVAITTQGSTINVHDNTVPGKPGEIIYDDLVGQPTWIGPKTISVTTLLRADIGPTGARSITLPKTLTTMNEVGAMSSLAAGGFPGLNGNLLTFTGTWNVLVVRHIGKFRDPQWSSWITVIEAIQNSADGSNEGSNDPAPSTGGQQTFGPELPVGAHSGFA